MKPATLLLLILLALPASAESGTLNADGVRIHYSVSGQGEPVVLIHGFTASAALNWEAPGIARALAKHYRVIMLDVRGHGRSDKPTSPQDYGLHMVDDVVRLLDRLGVKQATVVGYSMGGMIALKLAALHPRGLRPRRGPPDLPGQAPLQVGPPRLPGPPLTEPSQSPV